VESGAIRGTPDRKQGEIMSDTQDLVSLDSSRPLWDRFFCVFPLVLVGTMEPDGGHDLAPKHMAMPVSWQNWFGFVCSPTHRTYENARRSGVFTVSYPGLEQVVQTSLAAAPRVEDGDKPSLQALPVFPASRVQGVLVSGCRLYLECELDRIVEELGANSLLIGRVVAAQARPGSLRADDREDNEVLLSDPLFAYLHPRRFSVIDRSQGFPMPAGFKR
jgi:flavin reductase (DIM6/NTAB) family NADH-FMN oxidoreductase RutF